MRVTGIIIFLLMGSLLIYGSLDFPMWGDPTSPASTHLSPYYIEHTLADTSVPNIVTSVLADYRGYDTLFETIVIFTAGIVCIFLLRKFTAVPSESRKNQRMDQRKNQRIDQRDQSQHHRLVKEVASDRTSLDQRAISRNTITDKHYRDQ